MTYHFAFSAPGATPAGELQDFLHEVEDEARGMGFGPALMFDATFDTPERQRFARQLTTGAWLESEKLKGDVQLRDSQVWSHDNVRGACRVIPKRGVMLVLTDEQGRETVFGFLRYPAALVDAKGNEVMKLDQGDRWIFRDFVSSPDERFRKIVRQFEKAGYLESENDEFSK